jgi:hypothetical protein
MILLNNKELDLKENKFNYKESFEGANRAALLLCADYHPKTHMLVAGFSNGHFYLHEMPDFNIIHSLRFVVVVVKELIISTVDYDLLVLVNK